MDESLIPTLFPGAVQDDSGRWFSVGPDGERSRITEDAFYQAQQQAANADAAARGVIPVDVQSIQHGLDVYGLTPDQWGNSYYGPGQFVSPNEYKKSDGTTTANSPWSFNLAQDDMIGQMIPGLILGSLGGPLAGALGGGILGGVGAGAIIGGGSSALMGGDPLKGALGGAVGAGIGGFAPSLGITDPTAIGALKGAGSSLAVGGDPLTGALTGASAGAASSLLPNINPDSLTYTASDNVSQPSGMDVSVTPSSGNAALDNILASNSNTFAGQDSVTGGGPISSGSQSYLGGLNTPSLFIPPVIPQQTQQSQPQKPAGDAPVTYDASVDNMDYSQAPLQDWAMQNGVMNPDGSVNWALLDQQDPFGLGAVSGDTGAIPDGQSAAGSGGIGLGGVGGLLAKLLLGSKSSGGTRSLTDALGGLGNGGGLLGNGALMGTLLGAALGSQNGAKQSGTITNVQDVPEWMKPYYQGLYNNAQTLSQGGQNLNAQEQQGINQIQGLANSNPLGSAQSQLDSTMGGNYLNPNTQFSQTLNNAAAGINPTGAFMDQLNGTANGNYLNPNTDFQRSLTATANGVAPGAGNQALLDTANGNYLTPNTDWYRNLTALSGANTPTGVGFDELNKTASGQYLKPDSNPYLTAMYDRAAGQLKNQLSPTFGHMQAFGANSGYEQALGRSLSDLGTSLYGGAYESERARQLAASNALQNQYNTDRSLQANVGANLGSMYGQARGLQVGAANDLESQNLARQNLATQAASNLGSLYSAERARQTGAAGTLASQDTANRGLQLSAANTLGSLFNNERARQVTAAGMAPSFSTANLNNANALLQAGAYARQAPQQGMNFFSSILNNSPFKTTSSPYFTNPTAGILGGAMTGGLLGKGIFG